MASSVYFKLAEKSKWIAVKYGRHTEEKLEDKLLFLADLVNKTDLGMVDIRVIK